MKIAIVGFGKQGRSAYNFFKKDHQITICDQATDIVLPNNVSSQLGDNYLSNLSSFDLIIRSPFVHPAKITAANPDLDVDKISSNTDEFLKICPTKNVISVTGTKGKGTTSTLIHLMLLADHKISYLGGNIGIAPLDLLENDIQPSDWVVLELANFQTIDMKRSTHIAVCLMVVAEHLDWHSSSEEYFAAKRNLFAKQNSSDIAIYFSDNEVSRGIASASKGELIPYFKQPGAYVKDDQIVIDDQIVCDIKEIALVGEHNLQNICAAITAYWQVSNNIEAIRSVVKEFKGLEHRIELVRELNGITFINDSFGTTPETAIVAMKSFLEPKIVILGGSDKKADYTVLAQTISTNNIKKVILIGEQAERIRQSLDKVNFSNYVLGKSTMSEIVQQANSLASSGDVVLLSTACASFDMFHNYLDRGNQFKQAVLSLV